MNALRIIIPAFLLYLVSLAPATALAQQVDAFDGTVYPDEVKTINVQELTDLLQLESFQVEFINEINKEMVERLKDERKILSDNQAQYNRIVQDLANESRERVKEILQPEQLVKYEKMLLLEKQKKEQEMQKALQDQNDASNDAPTN